MNIDAIQFIRLLRTEASERFLLQEVGGGEVGAVDLHYLPSGKVAGTVILLDQSADEAQVARLLVALDEQLLPDVSIEAGSLAFTVVVGKVLGNFVPDGQSA